MPREKTFSAAAARRRCRFRVVQAAPALPKEVNGPGDELSEENVRGQHAGHDKIEQGTLQDERAPDSGATPAQRVAKKVAGPDSADAGQRQRQAHGPFVL